MRVIPQGGLQKGGPRQVPHSPPFKHTTGWKRQIWNFCKECRVGHKDVSRLDVAWGKKQIWRPHVRS